MRDVIIRKCTKKDKKDIVNVCYHTGYMGDDAEGHFQDKKLFGLLFCVYYPQFEPENGYIALIKEENHQKVVGYCLASSDTVKYEKAFIRRIIWKILVRLILITSWRYFSDFKLILEFYLKKRKSNFDKKSEKDYYLNYPAHLHIDILKEYQSRGLGSKLLRRVELNLKEKGVKGICLGTSENNKKAVPFYKKHGYEILSTSENDFPFWPGIDVKSFLFGKKI